MSDRIIKTEVKVILNELVCPECDKGKMKQIGNIMLATMPPRYNHECDNTECAHNQNYFEQYPTITYERKND